MRRHDMLTRHLNRKKAAGSDLLEEVRKENMMIIEPVKRGVRVNQIARAVGKPCCEIRLLPSDTGKCFRFPQHVRRSVDSGDVRVRPALGEQPGDISSATA